MWESEVELEILKLFLFLENRKINYKEFFCEVLGKVYIFVYIMYCGFYILFEGKFSSEIRI